MSYSSTLLPVLEDKRVELEVRKAILDLLAKINNAIKMLTGTDWPTALENDLGADWPTALSAVFTGIIETGDNGESYYIKFNNGVLINYLPKATMSGTAASAPRTKTWTFPYAFIDLEYAVTWYFMESTSGTGSYNSSDSNIGTYLDQCVLAGYASGTGASSVSAMAIGRWK